MEMRAALAETAQRFQNPIFSTQRNWAYFPAPAATQDQTPTASSSPGRYQMHLLRMWTAVKAARLEMKARFIIQARTTSVADSYEGKHDVQFNDNVNKRNQSRGYPCRCRRYWTTQAGH